MAKKSRGHRVPAHQRPRYAHWVLRAGAYLIDSVPLALLVWLAGRGNTALYLTGVAVALILGGVNRWYLGGGPTGQTLGRRALRLRLQSAETAQPIGPVRAFLRDVAHVFDTASLFTGWLFPIWDAERQTFADKIMKTHVVVLR